MPRRDKNDIDFYQEYCNDFNNEYINHKIKHKIDEDIVNSYIDMDEDDLLEEYNDNPEAVNNILNVMDRDAETEYNNMIMEIYFSFKQYTENFSLPLLTKLKSINIDKFLSENLETKTS